MSSLDFFNIDNSRGHKYTKRWINANEKALLAEIENYSLINNLINEEFNVQLWHFINKIDVIPLCYCGTKLKLISIPKGYTNFCSNKCSANSTIKKDKIKLLNNVKFGHDYYTQSNEYLEKTKKTNLLKYGVEYSTQSDLVKTKIKESNQSNYGFNSTFSSPLIQEKIKKTKKEKYNNELYNNSNKISETLINKYKNADNLNKLLIKQKETNNLRYGVDFANQKELIKSKNIENTKNSLLLKYGVDNSFKLNSVQDKIKNKNYELFKQRYPDLIFKNNISNNFHEIECTKCGSFLINSSLLYTRYRDKHEICTNCHSINDSVSVSESDVVKYIQTFGLILELNNRTILNGKELDIYIPSKNIAIEYNGLYWHSELYKSNDYHLNKTEECETKGIQLIHIFEDEWLHKQDIVKSRLKNILGLTENKIYARKTEINLVSSKDSKIFLDNNHIQGNVNSSIKLGLYYNNELVSLMTFNDEKNSNYNLTRFCNKLDTTVIGGADKLFKYFIKIYNPKEIISFSDKRWSTGNLYKKLNFKMIQIVPPSYWYIIGDNKFHKFNFRKNRKAFKQLNHNKTNNTEHEIMLENKIYRIYDCGLNKWLYKV